MADEAPLNLNFWEWAPKSQVNSEAAQQWSDQAQTAIENLGSPTPSPTVFDKPLLSPAELDSILNKPANPPGRPQGGGGLISTIANAVTDAADTVFNAPVIKQVLTPVQKLNNLQDQYIARPLAKGIVQDILGVDYDSLPGVVKFGLETLTSPTSWVGGGELLRAAGVESKLAELGASVIIPSPLIKPMTAINLLRKVPDLGAALPSISSMFLSPGSENAAKFLLEDAAAAPEKNAVASSSAIAGANRRFRAEADALQQQLNDSNLPSAVADQIQRRLDHIYNITGQTIQGRVTEAGPQQEYRANQWADQQLKNGATESRQELLQRYREGNFNNMSVNSRRGTGGNTGPASIPTPPSQDLTAQLQDSLDKAGKLHDSVDALQQRVDSSVGALAAAVPAPTDTAIKIMQAFNLLPDRFYNMKDGQQVVQFMNTNHSLTQNARRLMSQLLPDNVQTWIAKHGGIRLLDTDAAPILQEYLRGNAIAANFSGAASQQMEQAIKNLGVDNLNRVTTVQGTPYLEDFIRNLSTYNPTPDQVAAAKTIQAPVAAAIDWATAAGVKGIPDKLTQNGYWFPITRKEEAVVKRGVGAKQFGTYPDPYASKADAIGQGITLAPPVQAGQSFVGQMGRQVMDKWLQEAMKPYGKTLNDLLPQNLVDRQHELKDTLGQLRAVDRALQNSVKGQTNIAAQLATSRGLNPAVPSLTIPAVYPSGIQSIIDRANQAASNLTGTAYANSISMLRRELADHIDTFTAVQKANQAGIKEAKGLIQRAGGAGEYTTQIRGVPGYYTDAIGGPIASALNATPANDFISRFNNLFRPIMAGADFSFFSHQGLLGLVTNPVMYSRSVMQAFSSDASDGLYETLRANGMLDRGLKAGLAFLGRHDPGEFIAGDVLTHLPVVGPGFEAGNTWFRRFGNAMRWNLFQSQAALSKSAADDEALARSINLATGYSNSPTTRFEQIGEFAPRFFRSQLGLLADAVTKGSLDGVRARAMLRNLVISGTAMTYAVNKAQGYNTDFNPFSPNFLRMRIGDLNITPFGQWNTLAKAIFKEVNNVKQGEVPFSGVKYLAESKASPALGRLYDLLRGETYGRAPMDFSSVENTGLSLWREARQLMPMSAMSAADQFVDNPNMTGLVGGGLQAAAFNATPISASDLREQAAWDAYGKGWGSLEPSQRAQLQTDHPELVIVPTTTAFKARAAISKHFQDAQAQLDASGLTGSQWRSEYDNLKKQETGAYWAWEQQNPDAAKLLSQNTPKNANEQALQDYHNLFDIARNNGSTSEQLTLAIDQLQKSWTPEQAAYVKRNTGLQNTPVVQAYKNDQETLKPYWNIEDQVWSRLAQRPQYSQFPTMQSYIDSLVTGLQQRGIPEWRAASIVSKMPLIKQLNQTVSELRDRYRLQHPEADAALLRWGYVNAPARQSASVLAKAGQ